MTAQNRRWIEIHEALLDEVATNTELKSVLKKVRKMAGHFQWLVPFGSNLKIPPASLHYEVGYRHEQIYTELHLENKFADEKYHRLKKLIPQLPENLVWIEKEDEHTSVVRGIGFEEDLPEDLALKEIIEIVTNRIIYLHEEVGSVIADLSYS